MSQYDIFKILIDDLNAINRELVECEQYSKIVEYKIRDLKNGGCEIYSGKNVYTQEEVETIILDRRELFQFYPECKSKNYRYRKNNSNSITFKLRLIFLMRKCYDN